MNNQAPPPEPGTKASRLAVATERMAWWADRQAGANDPSVWTYFRDRKFFWTDQAFKIQSEPS